VSSDSRIDADTIRSYSETAYVVHGDSPVTLSVDLDSPALAGLHRAYRVDCSAFITACNPFSQRLDDAANAARQAALAEELKRRGLRFLDGIGQHPSNEWAGEPSVLVFGLALEAAKSLGVQFEQNAIIWCGADAVPRLILLR